MRIRIQPRFYLFLIALIVLIFAAGLIVANRSLDAHTRAVAEAQARRDALREKIIELGDDLDFAQTDEYVIRTARSELGLALPGEIRYVSAN